VRDDGTTGTCELVTSFCAFADATCTTMQRYDASAGAGLANMCVPPTFTIAVTPVTTMAGPYNFGSVPVGASSTATPVEVMNTSTAAVDVTAASSDSTIYLSTPTLTGVTTLPPGMFETFSIQCHPAVAQTYRAQLTFTTPANEGSLQSIVYLTCTGI
jgi:hypothetical protein